jgi:hypothetical protein
VSLLSSALEIPILLLLSQTPNTFKFTNTTMYDFSDLDRNADFKDTDY